MFGDYDADLLALGFALAVKSPDDLGDAYMRMFLEAYMKADGGTQELMEQQLNNIGIAFRDILGGN